MTQRRMTRVVDPTPTWARWTLGAGVTLTILAGFLRQPAG